MFSILYDFKNYAAILTFKYTDLNFLSYFVL